MPSARHSPLAPFDVHYWMLNPPDRALLHERLARRLDAMMAGGFLDEVRRLRDRGDLTAAHSSMRAVGYRQLWAHLEGHYDLAEGLRRALAATRQLAKRQLTWMRGESRGRCLDPVSARSWNRDICNALKALGF